MRHVKPGDTFVDIGANIGWFTLLASRLVGNSGHVIAFEPDPENYAILARNIERNSMKNVTPVKAALSCSPGNGWLYKSPDNLGDHRLFQCDGRESVSVELTRISDHIDWDIDFIKCDTQGHEWHVFSGMAGYFDQCEKRPPILLEVWPNGLEASGGNVDSLAAMFDGYGYDTGPIINAGISAKFDHDFEAHRTVLIEPR